MHSVTNYIKDFFSLFYPELCQACGTGLVSGEKIICTICLHELPYTDFHFNTDNKLAKQFWGRVPISSATALFYFTKGGKIQNLMHQLKYNNQPQIGFELGKIYGNTLKNLEQYQNLDAIIPVPLHPKKFKKRGYNQSEEFAKGLSEVLGVPIVGNILYRIKSAESQTTKSRNARFENMEGVFKAIQSTESIQNILLVDDTITTGATLETCALLLNKIGIKKINIVGIAFTA